MKNNKSPTEYAFQVMDILCLPGHGGFTNDILNPNRLTRL